MFMPGASFFEAVELNPEDHTATRIDGTRMANVWLSATGICQRGRWSVEWVRSGFVSHGSGIGSRVAFPARFCPSVGVSAVLEGAGANASRVFGRNCAGQ